jgi:hypothetical protein
MISKAVRSMAHSNKLSIGGDEGPECEDERSSSSGRSEAFLSLLAIASLGCFSEGHIHCPWFVCTITTQHPSQSNRCGKGAQKIMQGGGGHDTTCKSGLQFV